MKPILFNTEMVRAILDGRKTVTRRVVKEPWYVDDEEVCRFSGMAMHRGCDYTHGMPYFDRPYHPGDILYVRETWAVHPCNDRLPPSIPCKKTETGKDCYIYRADAMNGKTPCGVYPEPHCWRPSIHMPKEAARIFLRVTDVRVERLQDSFFKPGVTTLACQEEGIDIGDQCRECIENYGSPCCIDENDGDDERECECGILDDVRAEFADLWDSTIKPADRALYGWEANPWVWGIKFERITKEEAEHG